MSLRWWRKKDQEPAPGKEEESAAAPAETLAPESPPAPASPPKRPPAQPVVEPLPPPPSREGRSSWLARLSGGLTRTRSGFTDQLRGLFGGTDQVDDELFDDLEAILIQADCGPRATSDLVQLIRSRAEESSAFDPEAAMKAIRDSVRERLTRSLKPMNIDTPPAVVLIVGVNGVGKTTTIAKMARLFQAYGKRIMLVAGDTFRAGAIEQLTIWSQRLGCEIMKGKAGGDPSAIVFDAVSAARARGVDLVLVDTAGRLQTQSNLMDELGKIRRVIQKVIPEAPHETFLILDATTGQNALSQAKVFNDMVPLSGLVLTKLDGTAKGGVVVALADHLELPIRFLGVGEGVDDLDNFRPDEFVDALFS